MHLFVMSPALDRFWHLHPAQQPWGLRAATPRRPGGKYELFGDLVHPTGVSETVTGQLETHGIHGVALQAMTAPGPRAHSTNDGHRGCATIRRSCRSGSPRSRFEWTTRTVSRARPRALHGHARARDVRQARPESLCARASVRIGADGGDRDRDAGQAVACGTPIDAAIDRHVPIRIPGGRPVPISSRSNAAARS